MMTRAKPLDKIKLALSSPVAFRWIIALFLVQAIFSAIIISPSTPKDGVGGTYVERNENGVVPDGHRHLGAIYYYAKQPILQGPAIPYMNEGDLWMGDLVRFPSYLYYYLLSFPVRIAMLAGASDTAIIYLVRFIGIAFGLLTLFVLRSIVRMTTSSRTIQNITTFAFALTGSFVWLSAAENYDVMALMLWFAFVYASMGLFIRKDARYLYWMAAWFLLLSIAKYTYIPFAGLFGVVALTLYIRNTKILSAKMLWHTVVADIAAWRRKLRVWQIGLGSVLLIGSTGLFVERVVGNLVVYQSFNPSCTQIHTQQACMKFGVYARNYNQKVRLETGETKPIEYVPVVGYPAVWIKRYFDSMYVYMGHIYIPIYSLAIELIGLAAAVIGVVMLIIARVKRIRIFKSQAELYLLAVVVILTSTQFLFNLDTILNYGGQTYAHQGRYLLSVVGFSYILYLIVLCRVYIQQSTKTQKVILWTGLIMAISAISVVSAMPSFLTHAVHPGWYSPVAQSLLPEWITNR